MCLLNILLCNLFLMMSDTDFFSYTCNDMSYVTEISIDGVIHAKKDFLKILLQWVSGNLIEENP